MIPNQWYPVLDSKEVRRGRMVGVTRLGEKMVFWRDKEGNIACARDLCAHRGAAISLGKLKNEGKHVQCPFHGFQYDSTGKCVLIPANGKNAEVPRNFKIKSFPVREAHGFIWIWWGEPEKASDRVPFFDDIDPSFRYSSFVDPWKTHYSRCIENQLDVLHLPFVHHNTIGRGNQTLIHGPLVRITDNQMDVWYHNQKDDGKTVPLKPEQLPEPTPTQPHLHFIFPNIWQNYISPKMRIVIAFVPVDETNSLLYIRVYQNFMRIPVLRGIFFGLANYFSLIIAHQDRRVVETQRPLRTELKMGENLVPGDVPIVYYRKRRQELIDSGKKS